MCLRICSCLEHVIFFVLVDTCSFYKRFIDYIFIIWKGTLNYLKTSVGQLNTLHSIKFNTKYSPTSIEFLDTRRYKSTNGKLWTTLYTKPTDRQAYLHSKLYHPSLCKCSISYSQESDISALKTLNTSNTLKSS